MSKRSRRIVRQRLLWELKLERDRNTAATLSEHPAPARHGPTASTDIIERFRCPNASKDNDTCSPMSNDDENNDNGEASSGLETRECVACSDSKPAAQTYLAPCEDTYCAACLIKLFENSVMDQSLFPPRCCYQDMVLSDIRVFLGPELGHRVELKMIEHNTVDKTYCSNRTCSTFILPTSITKNYGKCAICNTRPVFAAKDVYTLANVGWLGTM